MNIHNCKHNSYSSFQRWLICFFLIVISARYSSGQNFERAYGGLYEDDAQIILPAFDGGYIMAGSTYNSGALPGSNYNILVVKVDSTGILQWSETIYSTEDDLGMWMEKSTDSTYLICGNRFDNTTNKYDVFVIRIDQAGVILFQNIYTVNRTERASCIRQTHDGGFILGGETVLGGTDLQMYLLKADSAGNIEWSKAFGDSEQETVTYVEQTNDNGYIISGVSRYGLTWISIYIIKTDSSGNLQWSKKYNTQPYLSRCDVSRIIETSDGGYIISGATTANQPLKSIVLFKIDSLGSIVWQNLYGSGGGERNNDISQDENGFTICGSTANISGYDDLLLMRVNNIGTLLWSFAFGVPDSNQIAYSMTRSKGGKYFMAGFTDAYGAGATDFLLVKSDSTFDSTMCNMRIPAIVRDTITLTGTPLNISSVVNTVTLNSNFIISNGVQQTNICSTSLSVSRNNQLKHFDVFPNPFSDFTTISFSSSLQLPVSLTIFDLFGRNLKTVNHHELNYDHTFQISSYDELGYKMSPGIYYCILTAGTNRYFKKINIIR